MRRNLYGPHGEPTGLDQKRDPGLFVFSEVGVAARQQRINAVMIRLLPEGELDLVVQAARLAGQPPSAWCREVVVATARRIIERHATQRLALARDALAVAAE